MDEDPNEIDLDTVVTKDEENNDIEMIKNTETEKKKKKKPKIQFRNYIPKCPKLRKKYCVPPAKFVEIKDEFTELIEKAKVLNHDIHDIAPKKENWDLKRDCQEQLDELKYLTKVALRKIAEEKQAQMSEDESSSGETETGDSDEDDDGSKDTDQSA